MKRLLNTKWSMQKKLILYMLILVLIIAFALFVGMLLIGRFDSAEKSLQNSLDFQMEAFEKDVADYFDSLTAGSIELSCYVADLIDADSRISGANFRQLTDDPEKIEQVQSALLGQLRQKLLYHHCSGIFVMLDATVNSQVENAVFSKTGLYLHHKRACICITIAIRTTMISSCSAASSRWAKPRTSCRTASGGLNSALICSRAMTMWYPMPICRSIAPTCWATVLPLPAHRTTWRL